MHMHTTLAIFMIECKQGPAAIRSQTRTDPDGGHAAAGRVSTMRCGSVSSTDARSDSMRDTEFSSAVPSAIPRTH